MSGRTRVVLAVVVAGVAAAGLAVAAGLSGSDGDEPPATVAAAPSGAPPLALDLGLEDDARTRALRQAVQLYGQERRARAKAIFERYDTLPARIGAAFAAWPDGTVARVRALADANPASAQARLNLGIALVWSRRLDDAAAAWRAAVRAEPDSISAVRADDLLHPDSPRGLPTFVPSFGPPPGVTKLPPARQLAVLERRAAEGGARDGILYGVALQRIGRPVSAERAYARAARLAPANAEAQVAAAVGRFRKGQPGRAFSRLGPLTQRFPRSASVRFHLGLLLIWLGQVDEARAQLGRARAIAPGSPLAREANRFLERLGNIGSR